MRASAGALGTDEAGEVSIHDADRQLGPAARSARWRASGRPVSYSGVREGSRLNGSKLASTLGKVLPRTLTVNGRASFTSLKPRVMSSRSNAWLLNRYTTV